MPVSIIVAIAAIGAIAPVGITIYRRSERRTPHLTAFVDGEVTGEMLPDAIRRSLDDPRHRAALVGVLGDIRAAAQSTAA